MGSKNEMTRKEFLVLTFTLVGSATAAGACSSDNNNVDASFGGNNGNAGTTGGGGTTGAGGRGGAAGNGGTTGTGGGGGNTAASCSDPLPETQSPADHVHTVTISASKLNATTPQTFDTSVAAGHMHAVTLQPSDLTTLKGGGTVMVMSTVAVSHTHTYTISCH